MPSFTRKRAGQRTAGSRGLGWGWGTTVPGILHPDHMSEGREEAPRREETGTLARQSRHARNPRTSLLGVLAKTERGDPWRRSPG